MTVVIVALVVSLAIPTLASAYSVEFSDVKEGKSHYTAIMELTEAGIISGYGDGTFGIGDQLQRRHGAVLLYNARDLTTPDNVETIIEKYYNDVSIENTYAEQIAAVTPAIFTGSDGSFRPLDDMTREQMATTIVKAFQLQDKGTDPGINLTNVSDSHKTNVKILAQYKVTNQLDDFRPGEEITRGQFATFIYKTMNRGEEPAPEDPAVVKEYTTYSVDFTRVVDTQMTRTPKVDGAGRFLASRELVEYYANPNTYSEEAPEFFQFLLLSYSDGLSAAEINEKVLKGKGSLEGTADAFIKAGKMYNINVIYLIAHALHESGNGTSDLSTGYLVSEVKGAEVPEKMTYNMFGIRAYDSCPLRCGSEHAYEQEWFTPEAAIIGGAQFINSGYIGDGQDTLYKMRWNPNSPGYHQYATHVSWSTIQARNIQKMYELYGLIDSYVLRFDIPKYNNQPSTSLKPTGEDQYAIDTSVSGMVGKTTTNLNLRTAPSTSYSIIATLAAGTDVTLIGQNGSWYKVSANGKQGWVSGQYVILDNKLQVINIDDGSSLNVRAIPSGDGAVVGDLLNGEIVTGVIGEDGQFVQQNGYYKILFNKEFAWVHGDFIKKN